MHDSVKEHIISNVPALYYKSTIQDLRDLLEKNRYETINYAYLLSKQGKLKGVISIKEIFRQPHDTILFSLVKTRLISARLHTSQERVAYLALKHNIKSIPIVDREETFLGIVPSDKIHVIVFNEINKDIFKLVGEVDDISKIPLSLSIKRRLLWLFLGVIGGVFMAEYIDQFEFLLKEHLILAAFIPLMVYVAGTILTQMQVYIIRDLAIKNNFTFFPYFAKQFFITAGLGVVLSSTLFFLLHLFLEQSSVIFIISFSLLATMLSSVVTGLSFPYLFYKFKIDPANASGPIAAIIQDFISILIYFSIASILL